ncbi:MAG: hypothetical protein LBQ82_02505 [Treponema sp.]|jgi:hypothetical protein|nr:hypothetical protein [Treponema sp.]
MKTKKHGVFAALAAVLLIAAALIASCVDPETLNGSAASNNGNTGNFVPPAGKSYIQINLGGSAGRTIMPASGLSLFDTYTVDILTSGTTIGNGYPKTGQTKTDIDELSQSVTSGTSYTVKIDAYIGTYLAASGTSAAFSAVPGPNPVTINLTLASTHTAGNGVFGWDVSYAGNSNGFDDADLDSATLSLSSTVGGTSVLSSAASNLLTYNSGNGAGSATIGSGVYYVTVSLAKAGYTPVVFTDVVHIYQDMTTEFTKGFVALTAVPTYHVLFNNYNIAGDDETAPGNLYTHGETIVGGENYPPSYPTATNSAGFLGWFTTASALDEGSAQVALTQKVFKDYTLFGRWYSSPLVTVTQLTFNINDLGNELGIDEDNSETTISKAQLESGNAAVIEMDITGIAGASAPGFVVNGHEFSGETLTIEYGGTPNIDEFLVSGSFQILMKVTVGGKVYDKLVTFTIN